MKPIHTLVLVVFTICASARGGIYNATTEGYVGGDRDAFAYGSVSADAESLSLQSYILTLSFDQAVDSLDQDAISGNLFVQSLDIGQGFRLSQFQPSDDRWTWTKSYLDGGAFANKDPNVMWELSLTSDYGIVQEYRIPEWSLNINPIPEPVNVALGIFGGVFGVVTLARSRLLRNRIQLSGSQSGNDLPPFNA